MQTKINRREIINLCADALTELERACRKHPEWPTRLTDHLDLDDLKELVPSVQWCNDNGHISAQSILDEEYYEFLLAVMEGDAKAARAELVQTIAMMLRQYAHLDDYIAQYNETALMSETDLNISDNEEVPNDLPY